MKDSLLTTQRLKMFKFLYAKFNDSCRRVNGTKSTQYEYIATLNCVIRSNLRLPMFIYFIIKTIDYENMIEIFIRMHIFLQTYQLNTNIISKFRE